MFIDLSSLVNRPPPRISDLRSVFHRRVLLSGGGGSQATADILNVALILVLSKTGALPLASSGGSSPWICGSKKY